MIKKEKEKENYKGMDKFTFLLEMSREADTWSLSEYFKETDPEESMTVVRLSSVIMKLAKEYCEKNKEFRNLTTIQMIQAMKVVAGKLLQSQSILQEQDVQNRKGLQ